jgi:hypothetical protein
VQPVLTSAVAVIGTLLGSVLTYLFQRRNADQTQAESRRERARQELVESFSSYASATMTLRRAEYDRWNRRRESADGAEPVEVRQESYKLRGEAWGTYFRLRLLTEPGRDEELLRCAAQAIEEAGWVSKAKTSDELHERGERARAVLDEAVSLASARLDRLQSTRART